MIDKITYTKEHLLSLVKKYKTDPQLLERAKDDISFIEILDKSNLPIERKKLLPSFKPINLWEGKK